MYISEIYLKNYRNYEEQKIITNKDVNIIYGKNAQGKTNLIEAIYLCSTGRSHRKNKDSELVKDNKDGYYVKIKGYKDNIPFMIEILYKNNEKKYIKVNSLKIDKIGEMFGTLNTVIFSPEDLLIIKLGPSERRKFLNILISQINKKYFYELQIYNRIIKQKNAILKKMQKKDDYQQILRIYNEKLAKSAEYIINVRREFIKLIEVMFDNNINRISNKTEKGKIEYISTLGSNYDNILYFLEKNSIKEIKKGQCLFGCHRDDFEIYINGRNVKTYGSQGQQRSCILALKLAEIEIMKEKSGYYPVLLLDDVMSELDLSRRKFLIGNINTKQIFITSTEKKNYAAFSNKTTHYLVKEGNIIKRGI